MPISSRCLVSHDQTGLHAGVCSVSAFVWELTLIILCTKEQLATKHCTYCHSHAMEEGKFFMYIQCYLRPSCVHAGQILVMFQGRRGEMN